MDLTRKDTRQEVANKLVVRQKNICTYCTKPISVDDAVIDHIIPKFWGERLLLSNKS